MKAATQVLPQSYALYHHFDETKYKKAIWVVILLGGLAFWFSFVFFNNLAGLLRPEYQSVGRLHFQLSIERLIALFRVLLPVALVLILHESIHATLLWLYTKERPKIVTTFEGIGGIAVRMPSWYLSRNAFLIVNLAPVCLMTLATPFLILVVSNTVINTLVFCAALNLAGSLSDIISSAYIYSYPASTYLDTNGSIFHDQELLSVSNRKLWLRSGIEWFLTKLELRDNNEAG
jgi:NAD/NADP transhydrogenase beta subunit